MTAVPVNTLEEYLRHSASPSAFIYRGVSRSGHELVPSIGRAWQDGYFPFASFEKKVFEDFRRRARPWLDFRPRSDWEWLMLAQHHRVPTRLLDWTTNPLVALFFACCDDRAWADEGRVLMLPRVAQLDPEVKKNPFRIDQDYYLEPPHLSPRIVAQSAGFTVSKNPTQALADDHCQAIAIPNDRKQFLLQDLKRLGVHHASLFPGLDGLGDALRLDVLHQKFDFGMLPKNGVVRKAGRVR